MRKLVRTLALAAAGAATIVLTGCTSISPGNVGIEISKAGSSRGVQDVAIRTGWVFYNPMWTQVIEYPTFMQTVKWTKSTDEGNPADESISFTTKDSATVNVDVAVSYQIDYQAVPQFYVTFRADEIEKFTDGYFRNVVRNQLNDIGGNYGVEQIMGNNGVMLKQVEEAVQTQLKPFGIVVTNLGFIGAPRPPKVVTDAINAKLGAQQLALQKQNEIVQAEAEAKKNEAYADGDAQANIIRAKADAEANKLRNESLSPQLLEWTALQKWNGQRPQVEGSGAGLMLNLK